MSIILSMLIAANAPNPESLAVLIENVSAETKADPVVVTKIVIAESRGMPYAVNTRTGDYGLMQINLKSHPEVSAMCALTPKCNIRAGIKILSKLNRICEYNTGPLTIKKMKNCLKYEQRLSMISEGEY